MGFVHSPSTELGSAKCSPDAAQMLALCYKVFLSDFDRLYTESVLKMRLDAQGKTLPAKKAPAPPPWGGPSTPASRRASAASPSMFESVIVHAHVPTSELHRRGVPEKVIEVIEANRGDLQKAHAKQTGLQNQLRLMQQSTGDRNGPSSTVPNMKVPFGGSAAQQNAASGSATVSGMLWQPNPPNPFQGNNFLSNRQLPSQPRAQWDLPTQQTKEHLDKPNQPMQGIIKQDVAPSKLLSIMAVGLLVLTTTANSSIRPTKRKAPTLLAEAKQPLAKRLSSEVKVKHEQESQDTASEQVTEAMNMDENPKVQDKSEVSNILSMIMEAYDLTPPDAVSGGSNSTHQREDSSKMQESPPLPEPSDFAVFLDLDFSGTVDGGGGSSRAGASELHIVSPPSSSWSD
jgi:hypothetical protein